MFRVLTCLTQQHDWRLVALAVVVCFLASAAAVNLFHRACATSGHARGIWVLFAGVAGGCGIWATHFIAILAYEPGVSVGYDVGLTGLSLLTPMVVATVGIACAVRRQTVSGAMAGGAIVGAGVSAMHFMGMSALELPGRIVWEWDLVGASIVSGLVLCAAAQMVAVQRHRARSRFVAAGLLALAVIAVHFTGMGAVEIVPDPARLVSGLVVSPEALAISVAAAAVSILGMCLVAAVADRMTDERLREQNLRLDAALSNMCQGLVMFDPSGRLVLCNERYRQMYGLSAEAVRPGCTLRDLLRARRAAGSFAGDIDEYIAGILAQIKDDKVVNNSVELADGRIIAVVSQPMADGGWVATHEDVTERRRAEHTAAAARAEAERAEREARAAHARLLDAFEVVPEGLAMFDPDDRLVLCNRRYSELFSSFGHIAPGMRFEDILRAGLGRGVYADAYGREEAWLAERLARHTCPESSHEQRYTDGTWVRVQERRTADGGSIGVRIDITELKRREASFRLLFEGSPVPMWVYDRETLRFLAVNDAAVAHYGYPRAEFLTKTLFDIRPREDRLEVSLNAGRGEGNSDVRRRHVKADGSEIVVAIFSRSLNYEGRPGRLAS